MRVRWDTVDSKSENFDYENDPAWRRGDRRGWSLTTHDGSGRNTPFWAAIRNFYACLAIWLWFEIFDFFDFLHPNPTFGTQIPDLAGGSLYPNPIAPEISGGLGRKNGRNTRFWAELHRFYAFPVIWGWFEIFDFFDFLAPESQFWWMGNVPLPNWKNPEIFHFWSENFRWFLTPRFF